MPTIPTPATFAGALALATIKSTAILVAASLGARVLRRRSATLRHAMWTAALASTIAVAMLPAVLPAWSAIRVVPERLTFAPKLVSVHEDAPARNLPTPSVVATEPAHAAAAPIFSAVNWVAVTLIMWFAGVIVVAARDLWAMIALRHLARGSAVDAELTAMAAPTARDLGITRAIRFVLTDHTDVPLTWGVLRPIVAFPAEATEWSDQRRRHVLLHELAHVTRYDAVTHAVADIACAVFWFNPLAWYAAREMRRERERACDDCVIMHGAAASSYAHDLLALATSADPGAYRAALAFVRKPPIEARLSALLDTGLDRRALGRRQIAIMAGAAALVVAPVAAIRTADARPTQATPPATVQSAQEPAPSLKTVGPLPRISRPASRVTFADTRPAQPLDDVFASCAPAMSNHMHSDAESSANDATWTASGQINDCKFELKSTGIVVVDAAATGFERLGPNAVFDVTTTIHGDVTRLVVHATEAGVLSYEFVRNGRTAPFDGAGRLWLAQFLVGLDRTTAFAIDRRFPVLLKDGVANVLDEIDRMHSDYARVTYARRLIAGAALDASAVHRVNGVGVTGAADHQAGDVITDLAAKLALDAADVRADLGRVRQMRADYEKFRTLDAIARSQRLDDALRGDYTTAANTIREERMRSRALAVLSGR